MKASYGLPAIVSTGLALASMCRRLLPLLSCPYSFAKGRKSNELQVRKCALL